MPVPLPTDHSGQLVPLPHGNHIADNLLWQKMTIRGSELPTLLNPSLILAVGGLVVYLISNAPPGVVASRP